VTEISLDSLKPGKPQRIEVDGVGVCVARVGDDVYAVSDLCSHSDASLAEGELNGFKLECWLHGAEFDIRDGAALTPPATVALETFSVARSGDNISITKNS
jgi:3-phenylpropionate/trans-cinnamate dioxygenase ferredoxin subunit